MPSVRRCSYATAIVVLFVALGLSTASASTIHVPADQPTIQQGIFSASNADTIVVAPGTYFEQINFVGKAVTVVSSDGPSVTTLAGFNAFTIVTFQQGEGNGSVLRGFTISGANGSGIMVLNASPI